jgi:hypothetical protein
MSQSSKWALIPTAQVQAPFLVSGWKNNFFSIPNHCVDLIMKASSLLTCLFAAGAQAWMPADRELPAFNRTSNDLSKRAQQLPDWKIRGVNLGGWLLSEPWMMNQEWSEMGCGDSCSEFDCVNKLGQSQANIAFDGHYSRWITPSMIQDIHNAGLNTIRIPIGYWSLHSLVDSSEYFPEMNLQYLDAVIQKAADLGMFVVIDLHGAPGAQKVGDAFTGQVSLRILDTSPLNPNMYRSVSPKHICQVSFRKPIMTAQSSGSTG